jgi:hypothetical protein
MEMDRSNRPSAETLLLTFVGFEPMETCLPDDVHPFYDNINPNYRGTSKPTGGEIHDGHTVDKRGEIRAVVSI